MTISKGDTNLAIGLISMLYTGKAPYDRGSLLAKKRKLVGSGFLLNPKALVEDKETDIIFKMQYLRVASMRDYTLYQLYGIRYLPLSYFPDIDLSKIKHNPLLVVKNNNIHLKYEE